VLESVGDFKSVLNYLPNTATGDFVSLTMPVRTESYTWDDQLPPVLQMNLPEGYLLQVLQEQFGPHIGASPMALLSVIGRNMVGRIQVAAAGAVLEEPAKPIEVAELLQGDNSEKAFAELVRQHATSGVSGVLPKFLDIEEEVAPDTTASGKQLGPHQKATLLARRHIIKGSSDRLPFAALNEYLCMQVMGKVLPSAKVEVSEDGNALVYTALMWTKRDSFFVGWKISALCLVCVQHKSMRQRGNGSPAPSGTTYRVLVSTKRSNDWLQRSY
jgi:serine/threonine-protein kinase HipA